MEQDGAYVVTRAKNSYIESNLLQPFWTGQIVKKWSRQDKYNVKVTFLVFLDGKSVSFVRDK